MSDFQNAIIKLMSSPHYKELAAYKPPFNPFEIVGATHRELIHSSVLAWLLGDEANKEFRQRFIDKIATDKPKLDLSVPNDPADLKPKEVKTEYSFKAGSDFDAGSIDVFAHFESLNLIIGIEVKVWAGEQLDQVTKYQKFLCQNYSGYEKVIVFLTPTGGKPRTADENNVDVPVLVMSWGCVSDMIREMRSALGDENNFRMQFLQHLERNIVMNETEEQRIVRELLSESDDTKTLNKIIMNETEEERIVRELLSEGDNAETLNKILNNMSSLRTPLEGDNAEALNKILNNMSSLRTPLECEFWIELRKQLQAQLGLRNEELEFQLYQSGNLEPEVIDDERLEEYINKWRVRGSPGLTFRMPESYLDDGHYEVVCRITYDPPRYYYLYYGFVLCKKNNIRERVEIENNDDHKEYLSLYRNLVEKKLFSHGPDKGTKEEDRKNGWLGWKVHTDVETCFADGAKLFNTLVNFRKHKKEVIREIRDVVNKISKETKETRDRRIALTLEKSGGGQDSS